MDITQLFRTLGIPRNYIGYRALIMCVNYALEDDFRLLSVISDIYIPVANALGTSHTKLEKNMRTVVTFCWEKGNRAFLDEIAGFPLERKPTVSQFIDMVATYIERSN